MTSGPCTALSLERVDAIKKWRQLLGPTNVSLSQLLLKYTYSYIYVLYYAIYIFIGMRSCRKAGGVSAVEKWRQPLGPTNVSLSPVCFAACMQSRGCCVPTICVALQIDSKASPRHHQSVGTAACCSGLRCLLHWHCGVLCLLHSPP
jgi:Nucleoside diphosphate kinase